MAKTQTREVLFFRPTLPQQKALDVLYIAKPFITLLKFGRQTGKSYLALMDMITRGMNSERPIKIRFVVPVYSLAIKHMQTIDMLFDGHESVKDMIFKKIKYKEQEYHFHNGTIASFISAEAEDNLRGDTADFMYIDEAAFIKETVYTEILLPMLTRTRGRLMMFSTPNGRNWFYDLYNKGTDPANKDLVISVEATYLDLKDEEDFDSIQRTILAMKESMTSTSFQREVMGEFVSDQSLFYGVDSAIYDDEWIRKYKEDELTYIDGVRSRATRKFIGIDIGVVEDYTALTLIDENGVVLDIDYFNMNKEKYNHAQFKQRIVDFINKYKNSGLVAAYMEINNKEILFDELSEMDGMEMLFPIRTSITNKPLMIDRLRLLFEKGLIRILNDKELIKELYAFTSVQNPTTGKVQYRGSEGIHDDLVMSLAIANFCREEELTAGFTEVY